MVRIKDACLQKVKKLNQLGVSKHEFYKPKIIKQLMALVAIPQRPINIGRTRAAKIERLFHKANGGIPANENIDKVRR
jgi:hypothetical protein